MTALARNTVILMANHLVSQMNNGVLKIYGAGNAYPRYVGHAHPPCAVEFAEYRLGNPCGYFDDTGSKSQIIFNPITRVSHAVDAVGYPNYFRIYSATNGAALYQGACRCVDYAVNENINGAELTPNILTLKVYNEGNDYRTADTAYNNFRYGIGGFTKWEYWLDVKINDLSIDFGGAA